MGGGRDGRVSGECSGRVVMGRVVEVVMVGRSEGFGLGCEEVA